jgi:hypothetical protein
MKLITIAIGVVLGIYLTLHYPDTAIHILDVCMQWGQTVANAIIAFMRGQQ